MSSVPQQPPTLDGDRPDVGTGADTAGTSRPTDVRVRGIYGIGRLTRRGRRIVLALLGFLIASLVVPAATKQWSDRSGELALKKELVSQINTTVTKAVAVTDCTTRLQSCFPEGRALKNMNASQDAKIEADVAYGKTLFEARVDWYAGNASITSVLDAYFAGTNAGHEWAQHAGAVSAFLRLSTDECGKDRDKDTGYLQRYLPETNANVWTLLQTNIGPDCQTTSEEFEDGYQLLAHDLLAQTPRVTRAVINANTDGYSSGVGDFFRDLWPL